MANGSAKPKNSCSLNGRLRSPRSPNCSRCDSSFRRVEDANPESRDSPMCNCTSEVWSFEPSWNDHGGRGQGYSIQGSFYGSPPRGYSARLLDNKTIAA